MDHGAISSSSGMPHGTGWHMEDGRMSRPEPRPNGGGGRTPAQEDEERTGGSDSAASTASQGELEKEEAAPTPGDLEAKALDALREGDYSKLAVLTSSLAVNSLSSPDWSIQRPSSVRKPRQWSQFSPEPTAGGMTPHRPATAPANRPPHARTDIVGVSHGSPQQQVAWVLPSFEERLRMAETPEKPSRIGQGGGWMMPEGAPEKEARSGDGGGVVLNDDGSKITPANSSSSSTASPGGEGSGGGQGCGGGQGYGSDKESAAEMGLQESGDGGSLSPLGSWTEASAGATVHSLGARTEASAGATPRRAEALSDGHLGQVVDTRSSSAVKFGLSSALEDYSGSLKNILKLRKQEATEPEAGDVAPTALRADVGAELDWRSRGKVNGVVTPENLEEIRAEVRSEMGMQAAKLRAELESYRVREEEMLEHQVKLQEQQALIAHRLDTLTVMAASTSSHGNHVLRTPHSGFGSPPKRGANKILAPAPVNLAGETGRAGSLQSLDLLETIGSTDGLHTSENDNAASLTSLKALGVSPSTVEEGAPALHFTSDAHNVSSNATRDIPGKTVGGAPSVWSQAGDDAGSGVLSDDKLASDAKPRITGEEEIEDGVVVDNVDVGQACAEGDDSGEATPEGHDDEEMVDEARGEEEAKVVDEAKVAEVARERFISEPTHDVHQGRDTSFTTMLNDGVKYSRIQERHEGDFGDTGHNVDELMRQARHKRWQAAYTPYSFKIFSIKNPIREAFIRFLEWKWFDRFILITIAANCAVMASEEPENQDPEDQGAVIIAQLTLAFQVIFTVELITKVMAIGLFMGPGTYFRDGWNCLDAFIVLTGWMEYLPVSSTGNTSMLRTFRLLRPLRALRAVGRFKDLRMLVELLISCIPMLANVFGLISFIFFVFGIMGVQLWQGYLRGRCYSSSDGIIDEAFRNAVCSDGVDPPGFRVCNAGYYCLKIYQNPWFNIISFDNIGGAMIVIFQVMIQQQWSAIMYVVWDSYSFWTWPYFILLNMVGPMFSIQLFLVVVANRYSSAKQAQVETEKAAVSLYEVKIGIVTASLPRSKGQGVVDPYVKLQVDDKMKRTRTLKNTSVPEWNEYYVFPVGSVATRCVIQMWNWQRTGPHEPLGVLTIGCGTLDEDEEGKDKWYELELPDGSSSESIMHVRAQWRRSDVDEWSPLPEVGDEDMPEEEDAEDEDKTCWSVTKNALKSFAEGSLLTNVTIFVILLNMVAMAADHDCYFKTDEYCLEFKTILELTNFFFTTFFTFELLVKGFGLGMQTYLKDTTNLFDVLIVLMSLIELPSGVELYLCYTGQLPSSPNPKTDCQGEGESGMSILRSFRLVRVLRIGKLVRSFPQIQRQLKVITRTLGAVSSLVMLILLFILIFAILGMSLFGGVEVDSLFSADSDNVAYFRPGVFCRVVEPGNPTMRTARMVSYNKTRYVGTGEPGNPVRQAPYEMFFWGDEGLPTWWISHAEDVDPDQYALLSETISEPMIVGIRPRNCFDTFYYSCLTVFQLLTTSDLGDVMYPALRGTSTGAAFYFVGLIVIGNFMLFNLFVAIIITGFSETKAMIQKEERENQRMIEADKLRKAQSLAHSMSVGGGRQQSLASAKDREGWLETKWTWFKRDVLKMREGPMTPEELKERSLKKQASIASMGEDMFAYRDLSALHCSRRISENRYFMIFILMCIMASSIALAAQRPTMPPLEELIFRYVNLGCNYVFVVECILKSYGVGFLKYLRSRWHQLDFFLVVTSIPDMVVDTANLDKSALAALGFINVFRIFRALRPLRIISRAKGLKVVLATIARAVEPVMNTVAIALCVFFVFGIMAVQLIGDKTSFCTDPFILTKAECVGKDSDGSILAWKGRTMKYNWIGNAMLSMFILASQDNWQCAMYAAVDARSREKGPYVDSNPAVALYFIAFMVVGSFFVIQLFVGVFIDTFQTVTGEAKALSRQGTNTTDKSSMNAANLTEPMSIFRITIFDVVTMTQFDLTIAFFIVANVIVMASEAYKSSTEALAFLKVTDFFFNFVFGSEVCAKLYGLYPKQYISSRWNRFDFIVVMISFFGIAIDLQGSTLSLNPTVARILRIFRIFRILRAFRIFKALEGLQKLVRTLIRSLSAVGNLGALLLLLFFIVGILTVELFGNLCLSSFDPNVHPGFVDRCTLVMPENLVDSHATFADLGMSLLTLFRICTSDSWSQIMAATMQEAPSRAFDFNTTISLARTALQTYLATGSQTALDSAREILPRCQTADELMALADIVSCPFTNASGQCATTCGSSIASSVIFSFFLCLSNFILLNLVMAVLMQELQEAMQMSRKTQSSLTVLMSVSAATNKWLSKAGESAGDSASPLTALMKDSSATGGKRESLIDSLAKRRNSVDTGLGNQSGASGHDGQQAAPGAPIVRNVDSGGKPQATANS